MTNNSNKTCKELFFLRGLACLSIVFLHSIGSGLASINVGRSTELFFDSVQVFLYFATPLFIFISMFILAYSYRSRPISKSFLRKRTQFIFLPFLFFAFFYSIPYASSIEAWGLKLFLNAMIGDYHGYFVLIIFQFFFLYLLLNRHLAKWNPSVVLATSFIINAAYLAFFNFSTPLNVPHAMYIWERFYWVPLFGWVFYFVLGYYCGYYYETFVKLLKKWRILVMTAPIVSTTLLLFLYHSEWLAVHSSKRVDMIFHTVAIGFFLFYMAHQVKTLPAFLVFISQYSFGIYLLHMFYISIIDLLYGFYPVDLGVSYLLILFLFSTTCSILTIYYMKRWKWSAYLLGKIGINYEQESTRKAPKHVPPVTSEAR
ncbi:acyltransferase family protein [Bacillus solitudinis]|uniref:acyltransferase family protein n=1 Tax=Bacillus solitudinis TaxID=2014074 RepID=UPI000C2379BF|nr:acyltransferase family protein [Bacillus solitudinis]